MSTLQRFDGPAMDNRAGADSPEGLPPHNLDAERAVLGSMLFDPELCDEIALAVRTADFYSDVHQKLFGHMISMHNEGKRVDHTLLVERLKQQGHFEAVGGIAYLYELLNVGPVAAHAVFYAEIVRQKAMLRGLIHAGLDIVRSAQDPAIEPREAINRAEERIFSILDSRGTGDLTSIHDVLQETFDRIDARMNREHELHGISTGFLDLDNLTGGLHDSELIILAARPGMGKTALAANIAEHAALESGVGTLFVSLEMSRLELGERLLSSYARIDGHKLRVGHISGQEQKRLVEKGAELSKAPLYVDDTPSRTIVEIAAAARRLKRKEGLRLIVIDYLQLIEPDNPRDPRQEQVARIARRLKGLARELKVPVLCLAQLNRQAEATKDNMPRLSHLRESGAIEQDADVVMFVHREEYYTTREEAESQDLSGKADLIIAKQRNGPTDTIRLSWRAEFTRFENRSSEVQDRYEF